MSALPPLLRYSQDTETGISRHEAKGKFHYTHANGQPVKDPKILARISGLGIPPAYRDIWICKDEFGHLQATGRDDANRKQYRYHPKWREFQDHKKFDALLNFAEILPTLRRKVRRDLRRQDNGQDFVCAALTRLIDTGALRIGHPRNKAVGASTLSRKHVKVSQNSLKLDYKAKSGKRIRKTIKDKSLARALQQVDDLPGRAIFQYIDSSGEICVLDSAHVNSYIGPDFTAKTFRTWHGSVAAFKIALKSDSSLTIKSMCEAAAKRLHNTPAICRNSYIHPKILELSNAPLSTDLNAPKIRELKKIERQMIAFLSGESKP